MNGPTEETDEYADYTGDPVAGPGSVEPARATSKHYKPSLRFHSDEAIRHRSSCAEAVLLWVTEERPAALLDSVGAIDSDELDRQIAGALCEAVEWDGRSVAEALQKKYHWPIDARLIERLQKWSELLFFRKVDSHRAQLAADRERRAARRLARRHA